MTILAEMSSTAQLALIGGLITLANSIIAGVMLWAQWLMKRSDNDAAIAREDRLAERTDAVAKAAKESSDAAAKNVAEVKNTLVETTTATDAKLETIASTGEKTHTLVNSDMGKVLESNRLMSRRIAELTKNADDIAVADLAEESHRAHEAKQATVDAAARHKPTGI
jgi:hypothetical protein